MFSARGALRCTRHEVEMQAPWPVRCRARQILLVGGLLPALLVKSTVGTALVLHQHGVRPTHLHVLGYNNRIADASSSGFGHVSPSVLASRSDTRAPRVVAIIATGVVFLPESRLEHAKPDQHADSHVLPIATELAPSAIATDLRVPTGNTASASILLRNHTLLI